MKFSEVTNTLDAGKKIKLKNWKNAYWYLKDKKLINHEEEGKEYPVEEIIFFGGLWAAKGDWEVIEDDEEHPYIDEVPLYSFGEAIKYLKKGKRVAREGWNGKNQYIELATAISYKTPTGDIVNCEHAAIGNAAIAFVGTSGVQMGWLASQADMLAEDWMLVD